MRAAATWLLLLLLLAGGARALDAEAASEGVEEALSGCDPVGSCMACSDAALPGCKETNYRMEYQCQSSKGGAAEGSKFESCVPTKNVDEVLIFNAWLLLGSVTSVWMVRMRKKAASQRLNAIIQS